MIDVVGNFKKCFRLLCTPSWSATSSLLHLYQFYKEWTRPPCPPLNTPMDI